MDVVAAELTNLKSCKIRALTLQLPQPSLRNPLQAPNKPAPLRTYYLQSFHPTELLDRASTTVLTRDSETLSVQFDTP
jgi:hypothetical protein